eukprot:TRINITY_DN7418_c0_g3_i1.p1 TRINITY_DN7418_c0_g3~~TRINITY_DN7418_c0_g3_i1.p1  ORF type:complete len:603 (-),score=150.44 TRINITY_DN7418_c0_g3_i1:164-1972(-)
MDLFDVLRQGCTFGAARRSKEVVFNRAAADSGSAPATGGNGRPTSRGRPAAASAAESAALDFFGSGTGAAASAGSTAPASAGGTGRRKNSRETSEGRRGGAAAAAAAESGDEEAAEDRGDLARSGLGSEEVAALRRRKRIHVGPGAPDPIESFDAMPARGVPAWLVKNLRSLGFAEPTPIQMQCFPAILAGSHVLASAPTGSGKTIAFLGPLLVALAKPGKEFARAVVVDPTRELAKQTLDEFAKLTEGRKWSARLLDKLTGEKAQNIKRLDLVVSTPLRLAQMLREDRISLDATRHLVLDEADKLLDLGFAPQIDEILSYCPKGGNSGGLLQTMMFSATLPQAVVELANSILTEPLRVSIGDVNAASTDIEQQLLFITHEDGKLFSFRQAIQDGRVKTPALIFVQSKDRAKQLFSELVYDGVFVDAIHADRTKAQRDNTIKAFRSGKIWMLICTDLMARGVDFKGVETVINYDFPQSAATYIHRIGRTGRAGRSGKAITFFTIADFESLRSIVGVMRQSGCEVPEWMLRLRPKTKRERRMAEHRPPTRKPINSGLRGRGGGKKRKYKPSNDGASADAGQGKSGTRDSGEKQKKKKRKKNSE